MKKFALALNYEKYYDDQIFINSNFIDHHFCEFFQQLKTIIEQNGDEFHTLDCYSAEDLLDAIIFVDIPHFPKLNRFAERYKIYKHLMGCLKDKNCHLKILYIWESPIYSGANWLKDLYRYFDIILSYKPVSNEKYYHFNYSVAWPTKEIKSKTISFDDFKQKKLACMIAGNKSNRHRNSGYKIRQNIIKYYDDLQSKSSQNQFFDLFGFAWGNGYSIRNIVRSIFYDNPYGCKMPKSYLGESKNKIATMNAYRFVFAVENFTNCPGYTTEKILDVFMSNAVPVYNGENILNHCIPKSTYIDINEFNSIQSLHEYLTNMDFKTYSTYLENIDRFIQSDAFKQFTNDYNAQLLVNLMYAN